MQPRPLIRNPQVTLPVVENAESPDLMIISRKEHS